MPRQPEYKPLLYTTTIRNPERFKDFMHILYRYNGQILTNNLIKQIECDLFKIGLYRPEKKPQSVINKYGNTRNGEFSENALSNEEAMEYYEMNDPDLHPEIKGHKEAGFDKGWPSRFETQFKLMKVLGFVNYGIDQRIQFSEVGSYLANAVSIEIVDDLVNREVVHPEYEQMAFLQSFAKQQRCNPFIRELNDNIPLILLLQTIRLINNDPEYNNCGIAYHEIPLIIFWKDNDANSVYRRIKELRNEYRYSPSNEVIGNICTNEILGGFKQFKLESIVTEYPDEFIRKMRMTGLISFRGAGRFIDINHAEDAKVDYIIEHYSTYEKYETEEEYFEYMSNIDPELFNRHAIVYEQTDAASLLSGWTEVYNWEKIKTELGVLAHRSYSSDNVLKFIAAPARLEFLTALAIKSKFPDVQVIPNYRCDDTGLPTSTAGGNLGDIECIENLNGVLVEVTMAEGRQQTMMEVWPISRHLSEFKQKYTLESQCVFVAPSIFTDTTNQILWLQTQPDHNVIRPYRIDDFVTLLENSERLYA